MDTIRRLFESSGLGLLSWQNLVMFAVGGLLIFLAVRKKYEPYLFIPIGFGAILANLPAAMMSASGDYVGGAGQAEGGLLQLVYDRGIETKFLPPVIFLGVGALTDFRPLLSRPITLLLGAAAQFGIVVAAISAFYVFGFSAKEAVAIGIIGGADGPTTIFVASQVAREILAAVAIAAYSYMALVPVIQPPIIRMLTTKAERAIDMPPARSVSQAAVLVFPVVTTVVASLFVPACAPLIGMLMFGNLLRESRVTERLSKAASGSLMNIVTIFLGLVIGGTMTGESFLELKTLGILVLGVFAFGVSTFGGVLFAKILNRILPKRMRINPCIGAAGVSAVPMAARVVQQFVARETHGRVNPLMWAMGPNVAGVIGSAVAAGVFLALVG